MSTLSQSSELKGFNLNKSRLADNCSFTANKRDELDRRKVKSETEVEK